MKKNGFIATSLIYSFFLIFCALLVSYVSIYLHNKNLLGKITDEIKTDLTTNKILGDVIKTGLYVKAPIYSATYANNDIKWIIIGSDNDNVILLSDSINFLTSNYNYSDQANLTAQYNTFKSVYLGNATYPSIDNLNTIKNSNDISDDQKTSILDGGVCSSEACQNDTNNIITKTYFYSNNKFYKYVSYDNVINGEELIYNESAVSVGARVVATVNKKAIITAGDGTSSNPYVLKYYVTDELKYLAINKYGNEPNKVYDLSGNIADGITSTVTTSSFTLSNYTFTNILEGASEYTIELIPTTAGYSLAIDNTSITIPANNTNNTITILSDGTYYINALTTKTSTIAVPNSSNGDVKISGTFKSIRIYNKKLTSTEIINNYEMDTGWVN